MRDIKHKVDMAVTKIVLTGQEQREMADLFDVYDAHDEKFETVFSIVDAEFAKRIGEKNQNEDLALQEIAEAEYFRARDRLRDAIIPVTQDTAVAEAFVKRLETFWTKALGNELGGRQPNK